MKIKNNILLCILLLQTHHSKNNNFFIEVKNIPKKIAAYLSDETFQKITYAAPLLALSYTGYLANIQKYNQKEAILHGSILYLLMNTLIYKLHNLKEENRTEQYLLQIDKFTNIIQLYKLMNLQYFSIIERCQYLLEQKTVHHTISPQEQLNLLGLASNFDDIFDGAQKLIKFSNIASAFNHQSTDQEVLNLKESIEEIMPEIYASFSLIMKMTIKNIDNAKNLV